MRSLLLVAMLAICPAPVALAQLGGNPQDPAGGQPPQSERGEGGEGGFRRYGPPPNPMFTAIDVDGDGVLNRTELRKAYAALKKLDADGDGSITLAEVTPASPWSDPAGFVQRVITENDKNGDGKLSADEVPERLQRMLENADQDGNGEFTREELSAAMENMRERFRGRGRDGFRGGDGGFSGRGRDDNPIGRIMQYDQDGNGLSPDEIPPRMQAMFRPTDDMNKDGLLDAAELQAVIARMGGAAQAIGAGGDPNTFRDPNRRNRPRPGDQN
jgi:Ca2+-binding EF-hand superfamily protein